MGDMTRERREELRRAYRLAIKGATPEEVEDAWYAYIVALYKEDGDLSVFLQVRAKARANGGLTAVWLLEGKLTPKQAFVAIRRFCMDEYAEALTKRGLASIDITGPGYRLVTRRIAFEVLQAFKDVDFDDKTALCVAMARNWNQFVRRLHAAYGLPTVQEMRVRLRPASDAEQTVLDSDVFETPMTPQELADWEVIVE